MSGPSPKLTPTLDEGIYALACIQLDLLRPPPVRFVTHGTQSRILGCYTPATKSITIYANMANMELERLTLISSDMTATLLHELKHAWQDEQHGSDWYAKNVVAAEAEAEAYAMRMVSHYRGMVRVTRRHHGGGLARLDARTAAVRQAV